MIRQAQSTLAGPGKSKTLLGSLGRLAIFFWALGMVLLPPLEHGVIPALLALIVLSGLYPFAVRRLARLRWLLIFASLFMVNAFFGNPEAEIDWAIWGLHLSSVAVFNGLQMILRAVVILLAADGLSTSVNITELAGLLERGGLHGLGFSIGVATNLIPDLRQSSMNAWHSLRMRGGLRASWWRGLQLLLLTILSNALRHAEEIVLAAEVRAFQPDRSHTLPLSIGRLDRWIVLATFITILGLILLRLS